MKWFWIILIVAIYGYSARDILVEWVHDGFSLFGLLTGLFMAPVYVVILVVGGIGNWVCVKLKILD